jgi:hypothetical protein
VRSRPLVRTALTLAASAIACASAAAPAYANDSPRPEPDFYRMNSRMHALNVPAPGVLANDADPDGDPLTAMFIGHTTYGGTVHLRPDGSFHFVPAPGSSGDNFDYLAVDGHSSSFGHVYITVTRPPVAHDDDYAALTARKRAVAARGVLANDAEAEHARLVTPPAHGQLELRGTGAFSYTSDGGFVGTDQFEYEAVVAGEPASQATATIRVKAHDVAPVAVDDDFTTPEDTPLTVAAPGLLANDTDPDGDPLTVQILSEPGGEFFDGGATDGSFYYEPPLNFDSPVDFTYRVNDGLRWSDPATATISIPAVDDPPFAEEDLFEMEGANSITVQAPGILSNDGDEVESDLVFARLLRPTHKGTLDLHADGSFTYTRAPGAVGRDRFLYQVYDSGGADGETAFVYLYPGHL